MPRRVKGPDGRIHQFPDQATDAQISAALGAVPEANKAEAPKAQTWSDQLGLNAPTDSRVEGFSRGAAAATVDMAQGAAANVNRMVFEGGDLIRRGLDMERVIDRPDVQASMTRPETTAGAIGDYGTTVATLANPVRAGAKAVASAVPSAARAGQAFKNVMAAAKDVPLNLKGPGDVALRIMDLAERGGSMPKAVRDFLRLSTDPNKQGMTYEVGRDLASNISRLSADEYGRLTPVMAREVANLRVALNKSVAEAAKVAGKADEYTAAMREYANAMRVRNVIDSAIDGVKKAAPYASVAGAGYWLSKKLGALID